MKFLYVCLLIFSTITFARTRSFFSDEEDHAMKAIHYGTFNIDGRKAAVIAEYNSSKLVVFKTNGAPQTTVSTQGINSIKVHTLADNYAYALFYDPNNALPSQVTNNLFSHLQASDIRSMKFGTLTEMIDYKAILSTVKKNTTLSIVFFSSDVQDIKGLNLSIKACDDIATPNKTSDSNIYYAINFEKSCSLEYTLNKSKTVHYFMITNNFLSTVNELIIKTRKIISNLGRASKSTTNKTKIKTYENKIKTEKHELKLLKQLLQRINE